MPNQKLLSASWYNRKGNAQLVTSFYKKADLKCVTLFHEPRQSVMRGIRSQILLWNVNRVTMTRITPKIYRIKSRLATRWHRIRHPFYIISFTGAANHLNRCVAKGMMIPKLEKYLWIRCSRQSPEFNIWVSSSYSNLFTSRRPGAVYKKWRVL